MVNIGNLGAVIGCGVSLVVLFLDILLKIRDLLTFVHVGDRFGYKISNFSNALCN